MSATTSNPSFGVTTEARTVAAAFPSSIQGKTMLITGVNKKGLGYATADALASQNPRLLILAGRSPAKVQECIDDLQTNYPTVEYRLLEIDLSDQSSVRNAANVVLGWSDVPDIDVIINNAGVMCVPERTITEDGVELHMATNHIGPFLLTNLLMPKLISSSQGKPAGATRIINLSSAAGVISAFRPSDPAFTVPFGQLPKREQPNIAILKFFKVAADEEMTYAPFVGYAQSKTANSLFSVALNQRLYEKHGIISIALHPGDIRSELSRHIDRDWYNEVSMAHGAKTAEEGAATTLVAVCDPMLGPACFMLKDCQKWETQLTAHAIDPGDAQKLWEISEGYVGQRFEY